MKLTTKKQHTILRGIVVWVPLKRAQFTQPKKQIVSITNTFYLQEEDVEDKMEILIILSNKTKSQLRRFAQTRGSRVAHTFCLVINTINAS